MLQLARFGAPLLGVILHWTPQKHKQHQNHDQVLPWCCHMTMKIQVADKLGMHSEVPGTWGEFMSPKVSVYGHFFGLTFTTRSDAVVQNTFLLQAVLDAHHALANACLLAEPAQPLQPRTATKRATATAAEPKPVAKSALSGSINDNALIDNAMLPARDVTVGHWGWVLVQVCLLLPSTRMAAKIEETLLSPA